MAIVDVKVPQLSESVAEATMLNWKKKPGEAVAQDEILIEIETDKVVLEVPAPSAGVLSQIPNPDFVVLLVTVCAVLYTVASTHSRTIAWTVWFVRKQAPEDRGPTACILIFIVFNAIFWLAFEQAGSSLNLFAAEMTDRYVGSWEMPATWFQSVGPLLIIILAPM